jgi:hypothetical protein
VASAAGLCQKQKKCVASGNDATAPEYLAELDAPPSKSATGHDRPPDLTDLFRADSREWCFSIKSARLAF